METTRNYWAEALARLDDQSRRVLQRSADHRAEAELSQGSSNVSKAQPYEAIAAISWPETILEICRQQLHAADDEGLGSTGQHAGIRKLLGRLVDVLDRIKQVGDIAVSADPIHAGLPWAAVRFLLTVIHST